MLIVVEAGSTATPNILAAVKMAASKVLNAGGREVSMSSAGPEFDNEQSFDSYMPDGVLYFAATGDVGGPSPIPPYPVKLLPSEERLFSEIVRALYAGLSENKHFGNPTVVGEAGPVEWIGKLQYGIEFSLRDIYSKAVRNDREPQSLNPRRFKAQITEGFTAGHRART